MKAHIKNPADFTISACTIAKNEAKTIARSINSYKKYADEIIVVDTGSTDDTVKIAQDLGAKVLHFEWCDDFAAAKNTALDAATGDWIIFLDADEYFADGSCKNLKAVIFDAIINNKNAIGCRKDDIDSDNNEMTLVVEFNLRVFKAGTRYHYPIHEEIMNPDGVRILSVDKSYFYLKHTGYSESISPQKCERNLAIMFKQLKTEKDITRITSYYLYISDAYYGLHQYEKSREFAEKFIEQAPKCGIKLVGLETKPYLNIITSLEIEKADAETIAPYVEKFYLKHPDCADASYAIARNYARSYQFSDALKNFDKALKLSKGSSTTYIDTVEAQKSNIFNRCGRCEEALLHPANAMDWYFKSFQEDCNHSEALFNLLRIVRGMPQQKIDSLVEPLYMNGSEMRYRTVLSALMRNYMVPQLVKCYASYRSIKKADVLNADVTAFIMAGEGNYTAAAKLFLINYKADKNKDIATRSLICAVLSGDKELITQALEVNSQVKAFALGLSEKTELKNTDIFDISNIYSECARLGKIDFVKEKINALAPNLDEKQLLRLSKFLTDEFDFETALSAARYAPISAESVFMQGYCFYRMHRLNEAAELLLLAKHMGYNKPAFDEIYNNIKAIRISEKCGNEASDEQKSQLKAQVEHNIQTGNLGGAAGDIATYMRIAEPDAEILAAQATLLYYLGEYKKAAISAECGLLKDENNFDLLYNAGCVYQKLGDTERAKDMYLKAIENCDDEDLANEISNTLEVINVNSGK